MALGNKKNKESKQEPAQALEPVKHRVFKNPYAQAKKTRILGKIKK